jgi:16S rRNA (adenine1518-N6/adenine1519-N6)-dimethyltransferase
MSDTPSANKSLGQHWLFDVAILSDIADCADITSKDTILEIGPGLGTLTNVLVQRAKQVVGVEFDGALAHGLPKRVTAKNLEIIEQDILQFNFSRLPRNYKVVANIPYYLTSNLIRTMSEAENIPERAIILVQKEVAERVAAVPGAMSILGVTAQFYWQVKLGSVVSAASFTPPPKIDSQILILTRRAQTLLEATETKLFFQLVKAGFSQRRKTLLNSLSAGLRIDKGVVRIMCGAAAIDVGRRAQSLSLIEWTELYKAYKSHMAPS